MKYYSYKKPTYGGNSHGGNGNGGNRGNMNGHDGNIYLSGSESGLPRMDYSRLPPRQPIATPGSVVGVILAAVLGLCIGRRIG